MQPTDDALQPGTSQAEQSGTSAQVQEVLGLEKRPSGDGSRTAAQANDTILVPSSFEAEEGAALIEGQLYVGRQLGKGLQGTVHEVVDASGRSTNSVLKAVRSAPFSTFTGLLVDMQWEWATGRRLEADLGCKDGSLPGFMKVGAALLNTENGRLKGMILEKLNGCPVSDRVRSPDFADIFYLREMLWQVFCALDKAQRRLGFAHWDLKLGNVMETWPPASRQSSSSLAAAPPTAPSAAQPSTAGQHGSTPASDTRTRTATRTDAAAAGQPRGIATEQPEERLVQLRKNVARAASAPHILSLETSQHGAAVSPTDSGRQQQQEAGMEQVKKTDPQQRGKEGRLFSWSGFDYHSMSRRRLGDVERGGLCEADLVRVQFKMIDFGHSEFNRSYGADSHAEVQLASTKLELPSGKLPPTTKPRHHLWRRRHAEAAPARPQLPPVPCSENAYRCFWRRRADVFRLLLSLSNSIDGKVWPSEDRSHVEQLLQLIQHITGVRLNAYYSDEPGEPGVSRAHPRGVVACYKPGGTCHLCRRLSIGTSAFLHPNNPGISAAEALTSPFLRARQPQAA